MSADASDVWVTSLTVEHFREPFGIGTATPRLSWTTHTKHPLWTQAGYEIEVGSDGHLSRHRSESAESVLVAWPAAPLASRQRADVRVRVWGDPGCESSGWSAPVRVEAGLLGPADWTAVGISPPVTLHGGIPGPALRLRHSFIVGPALLRARLYATAHGVYEAEINGIRIGDDVLAPGWTSYPTRLRYQTVDVTEFLHAGDNAIGVTVADGWYRGRLGFRGGVPAVYGNRLTVLAQIVLDYADGSTTLVGTSEHWRCARGPITSTGLYEGERYDARLLAAGWSAPGFRDDDWIAADIVPFDLGRLVAPQGPPVRAVETLVPQTVTHSRTGALILDFGQNISGRLRIRVQGEEGQTISLRHAEVLQDGELCLRPLRLAEARDEYTLAGNDVQVWEPRFTIHGFRYAEVSNWPGDLAEGDVVAVVCHTDMVRTGWFTCSDPMLERLHENVVWSMRGNFVDIPTDCPQRDERLGWTGDIQVFGPTASFLFDCHGMLTSWLSDLAAEQRRLGTVPAYVPWIQLLFDPAPAAGWGDVAVLLPWTLYQRFGDLRILQEQYSSMKAWVDQVAALVGEPHLWDSGFQFGDWLDPSAPPERPDLARTDKFLVATASHAQTTLLLAEIAALLGEHEDQERYLEHGARVRDAFCSEFVTPNGRLSSDAQTAYAMALEWDLLPKQNQRDRAGARLAELVAQDEFKIATGFLGTPLICDALTSAGAVDVAYHLLTQRDCPSWLYPVTMGATTIWERWDSLLPDGSVNPGNMTSFNHYALGAVADWLHRTVAGLAPSVPGYREMVVRPLPGGGLTSASATHDTPYGRASVAWTRAGGRLDVTVEIPTGTRAVVQMPAPGAPSVEVGAGRHSFSCAFREASDDPDRPAPFSIHVDQIGGNA